MNPALTLAGHASDGRCVFETATSRSLQRKFFVLSSTRNFTLVGSAHFPRRLMDVSQLKTTKEDDYVVTDNRKSLAWLVAAARKGVNDEWIISHSQLELTAGPASA
jgi:hypothetical protein